MIFDHIDNIDTYANINEHFATAVKFIKSCEFNTLQPGMVEIDGKNVYAVVTETELTEIPRNWEAHRRYTDIQLVIHGDEMIGYAPLSLGIKDRGYDAEKDLIFFADVDGQFCHLTDGQYLILFPWDIHLPNHPAGQASKSKKIIIKVRMD